MESTHTSSMSRIVVNPLFLFSIIIVTVIATLAIIYHNVPRFKALDMSVNLHHFSTQKMKEFGGSPVHIDVGLYINDFDKFDMNNDNFVFNGIITFEFDPSLISSQTLDHISFDRGEILYKSAPTSLMEEGRMFVRYTIKVQLSGYLNYQRFPFENHELPIIVMHKMLTPSDLIFVTKNRDFKAPDMSSVGWRKYALRTLSGYFETKIGAETISYPAAVFSIDYGRYTNFRNIFTILLPMLILFFIAQFSLILNPQEEFTFTLSIPVQTVAGIIAYRYVIESNSPNVGYFMYSDYFFFLFLFLMIGILLFHAIGRNMGLGIRKALIIFLNSMVTLFLFWVTL